MKKLIPIAVPIIVSALGIAVVAWADNNFNAAAACQSLPNSARWELDILGGVSNPDPTIYADGICPVDRTNFGAMGTMVAKVIVQDGTTTDKVCCQAFHTNAASSATFQSSFECTSVSGTGIVALDMTVPSFTGSFDYAYISCVLPPAMAAGTGISSIRAYRGVEQ